MYRELVWFLIAGFSAVGMDMGSYYGLNVLLPIFFAKGLSFVLGSIVAFIINKYKTFEKVEFSKTEIVKFSILYLTTLLVNVGVNHIVITVFPNWVFFAFLCATGTSTIINFIGQKFWVFIK
jgi:putative flippase GtrA